MSLIYDLRFAVRLIAKERWFTAVAVAALALGIGVNATVFALVNAVLIRGLPFKDSGQLYMLGPKGNNDSRASSLSIVELGDWRAQSRTFSGLAGFTNSTMNLADDRGVPEQARGVYLTANAFRVLSQLPLLGRDFSDADERRGAERVIIIGYGIWKNRYNGDPGVLGQTLRVNGNPATIIGVMPDGMMFPNDATVWMPFVPTEAQERRDNRALAVFGRLRPGITRTEAQAELNAIAAGLATQYPESNKQYTQALVQTFNERFNGGDIRQVFLSMMGAVGFVLLIACANVANLLLSRSASRAREIALRIALGASRWRVIRQLLVESVLLGCIGGVFGLLLAVVGVRLFDRAVSVDVGKPYWIQFTVDWTVVGFLAAICVVTGVIFGLAPALQVSKTNVNDVLKEGGRGASGSRRTQWLSGTMVVIEIALTLVLLAGAGLMAKSFLKLYSRDLGIRADYLLTMRVALPSAKYSTPEARLGFFERLTPRLDALPGAESVAVATSVPPQGSGQRHLEIEGRPVEPGRAPTPVTTVTIDQTFFETVGAPVVRGRNFTAADGAPGSETVLVNPRFVSEHLPGEDPIGRRIRFVAREPSAKSPPGVWRTIVGISPALIHNNPRDTAPASVVYLPFRQESPGFAYLLVRSRLEPAVMINAVRREVQAIDPDQPVFTFQTIAQMLRQQQWPYRVFGTVFGIFAVIALTLAAVGLYAVMAYSVTQRTQEIGVRMALGAAARQVSWLILRRGVVQLAIGLALGIAGAWFTSRALRPILFDTPPNDPATFVGIALLLSLVALAACLIPARRATRLDPLVALRRD